MTTMEMYSRKIKNSYKLVLDASNEGQIELQIQDLNTYRTLYRFRMKKTDQIATPLNDLIGFTTVRTHLLNLFKGGGGRILSIFPKSQKFPLESETVTLHVGGFIPIRMTDCGNEPFNTKYSDAACTLKKLKDLVTFGKDLRNERTHNELEKKLMETLREFLYKEEEEEKKRKEAEAEAIRKRREERRNKK